MRIRKQIYMCVKCFLKDLFLWQHLKLVLQETGSGQHQTLEQVIISVQFGPYIRMGAVR